MTSFATYSDYDALGLAELVRKREVTPDELLDAAIEEAKHGVQRGSAARRSSSC